MTKSLNCLLRVFEAVGPGLAALKPGGGGPGPVTRAPGLPPGPPTPAGAALTRPQGPNGGRGRRAGYPSTFPIQS